MTTNIMSIGKAAPSKQSLLGSAEISAEGNVIPQDADPSETPFLPMFLQMLFVQSQIKPVPEQVNGELAIDAEGTEAGTTENSGDAQTPVSILAGSIDGLTRLTMERTQPAMDALKSQLSQTQRPREGEDASMILPSLFGKNMRMPVANVQEIIRAVSNGSNPQQLGIADQLTATEQSSITLDAEEMKTQTARELLASLTQSAQNVDGPPPATVNGTEGKLGSGTGYIELDGMKRSRTSNVDHTAAERELKIPSLEKTTEDTPRVEKQQISSNGRSALLNTMKESFDEAVTIVSATAAAGKQNEEQVPEERTAAAVTAQPLEVKSEKKLRGTRPSMESDASKNENRFSTEMNDAVASAQSSNDPSDRSASEDPGMMPEKNPQQPVKQDAQEFRRVAAENEISALKAPSGLNEIRGTERIATEAFKPETIRSMMEQISKGVAVAVDENRSEMKLILHPEALGEVTVRVQVEEGKVTAKLDVQQVQVKNTIEASMPQLREALTARGLTMERIEISTAQNGLADGTSKQQQNRSGKRSKNGFDLVEEEEDVVKMYGYNTVEYTV